MRKTILLLSALPALALLASFATRPALERPNADFQQFLKQFEQADLPFALSAADLQAHLLRERDPNYGSPKFSRLQDPDGFLPRNTREMISRIPITYSPVAQLATADHHAVIYTMFRGYSRGYQTYRIAVFDKTGNCISDNRLAETAPEYLTAATVDHHLQAVVQTYRIKWEASGNDRRSTISGLTLETSSEIDLTAPTELEEKNPKRKPSKKTAPDAPAEKSLGAR